MRNRLLGYFLGLLILGLSALAVAPAGADPVSQSATYACVHSAQYAGTAGTSRLVAGGAASQIYVCGFTVTASAASTFQLEYGTGTNCASVGATITPAFNLPANGSLVDHQTYYAGIPPVPAGSDLCVIVGGTGPAPMIVYYSQF
jgi:hypothetical protein